MIWAIIPATIHAIMRVNQDWKCDTSRFRANKFVLSYNQKSSFCFWNVKEVDPCGQLTKIGKLFSQIAPS